MPPAFTVILPPTSVRVDETTRLKLSDPLTVIVLAVAVLMSTVTVVPVAISTGLQEVGIWPRSQVLGDDQGPFIVEVTVLQPTAPQVIRLAVSLRSFESPVRVPEYATLFHERPVLEP